MVGTQIASEAQQCVAISVWWEAGRGRDNGIVSNQNRSVTINQWSLESRRGDDAKLFCDWYHRRKIMWKHKIQNQIDDRQMK